PIGVVTLAERFGSRSIDRDTFEAMVGHVADLLQPFESQHRLRQRLNGCSAHMLGTSGTVTTLAGVHLGLPRYDRSKVDGYWLERQLNDPYVAAAKREGYRSRAAYKLIEIDDRQALLKPGKRVIDLGAAPGGWSQVAADRVRSREGKGQVVAIDLLAMEPIAG